MVYPDREIGSSLAARTWRAYMSEVLRGTPVEEFSRPAGIVGPLAIDKRKTSRRRLLGRTGGRARL